MAAPSPVRTVQPPLIGARSSTRPRTGVTVPARRAGFGFFPSGRSSRVGDGGVDGGGRSPRHDHSPAKTAMSSPSSFVDSHMAEELRSLAAMEQQLQLEADQLATERVQSEQVARARLRELVREETSLRSRCHSTRAELDRLVADKQAMANVLRRLRQEHSSVTTDMTNLEKAEAALLDRVTELRTSHTELQQSIADASQRLGTVKAELQPLTSELNAQRQRHLDARRDTVRALNKQRVAERAASEAQRLAQRHRRSAKRFEMLATQARATLGSMQDRLAVTRAQLAEARQRLKAVEAAQEPSRAQAPIGGPQLTHVGRDSAVESASTPPVSVSTPSASVAAGGAASAQGAGSATSTPAPAPQPVPQPVPAWQVDAHAPTGAVHGDSDLHVLAAQKIRLLRANAVLRLQCVVRQRLGRHRDAKHQKQLRTVRLELKRERAAKATLQRKLAAARQALKMRVKHQRQRQQTSRARTMRFAGGAEAAATTFSPLKRAHTAAQSDKKGKRGSLKKSMQAAFVASWIAVGGGKPSKRHQTTTLTNEEHFVAHTVRAGLFHVDYLICAAAVNVWRP